MSQNRQNILLECAKSVLKSSADIFFRCLVGDNGTNNTKGYLCFIVERMGKERPRLPPKLIKTLKPLRGGK